MDALITLLADNIIEHDINLVMSFMYPTGMQRVTSRNHKMCRCGERATTMIKNPESPDWYAMCNGCVNALRSSYNIRLEKVVLLMRSMIDHNTCIGAKRYLISTCWWCLQISFIDSTYSIRLTRCAYKGGDGYHTICAKCVIPVKVRKYTYHFWLSNQYLRSADAIGDVVLRCLQICAITFIY